jgi:hypothetical protein
MSIFGERVVVELHSTSMHSMPRRDSSQASVMPTGPPPAINTGTNLIGYRTAKIAINRS